MTPSHVLPKAKMPEAAMVFAAGLGARMRPITHTCPKPLVRVGDRVLMDYTLDALAQAGVARAIVNVHWLADQIETHLAARTQPRILISDERAKLLDQGGGIVKALGALGPDPFFICNTDAFWIEGPRSNLQAMADAWDPDKMDVLLLAAATANSVGVDWPGDFTMEADGALVQRKEGQVAPFVYSGFGIVKPELFAGETRDAFRLAPTFFDAAARGRLYGVRLDGLWLHVGTPEAIAEAEAAIARSKL
jgi:MurNAc alpha-1-phosphate uridylyltransferase